MKPESVLLTDLYELTMLQAYFDEDMHEPAVFELYVRSLPPQRNFLLLAGIEQALEYLENLHFTNEELDWLKQTGRFKQHFLEWLRSFRFTGDVHAMREGSVFFADEPVLRIEAPICEAQLVESRLMNLVNFSSLIASKAARCVLAAPSKLLVDFGLRRAHGAEAGLLAARSSYLAGFDGTATVLAGQRYDIPIFGTMAHAYIEAHDLEVDAFTQFAASQMKNVALLIDTYDTEAAARKVVALASQLRECDIHLASVRIDSGDLASHAHQVRAILDKGGLGEVKIFASGNLDETSIASLVGARVPIDGFGIGTKLTTSADAPYLDSAYKLQAYAGKPRRKRSEGKETWPGAKQVYRILGMDSRYACDHVTLEEEPPPCECWVPQIGLVMHNGRRINRPESLQELRDYAATSLARLPACLRKLTPSDECYPVLISPRLHALADWLDKDQH